MIKMGAAAFLGAFYQNEVSANKDYADETRAIANKLREKETVIRSRITYVIVHSLRPKMILLTVYKTCIRMPLQNFLSCSMHYQYT